MPHLSELLIRQVAARAAGPARDLSRIATIYRLMQDQFEWSPASRYAGQAADGLERLAGFIEEADADRVVQELRAFAVRKPLLFMSAAWL